MLIAKIGWIALGIYLLLTGLIQGFNIKIPNKDLILGIAAVVAGVAVLVTTLAN